MSEASANGQVAAPATVVSESANGTPKAPTPADSKPTTPAPPKAPPSPAVKAASSSTSAATVKPSTPAPSTTKPATSAGTPAKPPAPAKAASTPTPTPTSATTTATSTSAAHASSSSASSSSTSAKPAAPKPSAPPKPATTTTTTPKAAAAATPKPASSSSTSTASAAKPAATSTPKPPTNTVAKPTTPASGAPKPATSSAMKVEKTTESDITTKTTASGSTTTSTTTTTTTKSTPAKTTIVTTKEVLTTANHDDDSDDDVPLSALVTAQKKEVKQEKKGDTLVKKEKVVEKTEIKKETTKDTPKKRKAESDSDDDKPIKLQKRKKQESDSDADETPKKKIPKKVKQEDEKKTPSSSKKKAVKAEEDGEPKKKKKKKEGEEEEEEWKWWEEEPLPDGKKWKTLSHNGVCFAEPYVPHGVKFYYEGKAVSLSPEAEEVATFYAKYLETQYVENEIFNKNFWNEFRAVLTPDQRKLVRDFSKADFKTIHKYLVDQKEEKANRTTEEKKVEKEAKAVLQQKYGFALVNGHKQRISNWAIEKPGLFMGRGAHPKAGMVKKMIQAEDITINIGKGETVPEPPAGHHWAKVVHDDEVMWLAMWKENINDGFKYMWLHATSALKGRSDIEKFEVARNLKEHITRIRKKYNKELTDDDAEVRQRSTALYLIDVLALRVGNEKDDDTADTVGCCSLRVEHIKLQEPNTITLDFLGKDSMRYFNTVTVDAKVFKNLKEFMHRGKKEKAADEDLFDQLTPSSLNKYLKEFMDKLSAKVFRTFNASLTLQRELAKMPPELKNASNDEKVLFFNRCNREVAILCNHQRSAPKSHGDAMTKIDEKIGHFERVKKRLQQQILWLKDKGPKPDLGDSEDEGAAKKKVKKEKEAEDEKKAEGKKGKEAAEKKKGKEDDGDKKKAKKEKDDEGESKSKKRKAESDDFEETPKKKQALPDDVEKCKKGIERAELSIAKWNIKKTEKDELKSVALSTSKINYIDPRITASWAKRVNLPIEKLFSKSLREKFPWAMNVDEDFEF